MGKPLGHTLQPHQKQKCKDLFLGYMEGTGPFKLLIPKLIKYSRLKINAWMKRGQDRECLVSDSCQSQQRWVRRSNPIKIQRSEPLEVSKESIQGNRRPTEQAWPLIKAPLWAYGKGRDSSTFPMGMTPLILKDQNLNFTSNKDIFCLLVCFCLLIFCCSYPNQPVL